MTGNDEFQKLPIGVRQLIQFADVSLKHRNIGAFRFITLEEKVLLAEMIETLSSFGLAEWHGRLDNTPEQTTDVELDYDPYYGINGRNEEINNQG